MQLFLTLSLVLVLCNFINALGPNIVCFYDASGTDREGLAKFSLTDLEIALDYCTHLVYGYVGLDPHTFRLATLNNERDIKKRHFLKVTDLKDKFPYVKFLLSVGGGKDFGGSDKYIQLLESDQEKQKNFVESATNLVRNFNFDGLDLAFQLPLNKPLHVHSIPGIIWKSVKKIFTGDFIVDPKADEHKQQFVDLVHKLKTSFAEHDLMLSLTVLPNVNSSWYFNVPALMNQVDFVNLAAFDFTTPERNPYEADYTAPLFAPDLEGNRLPHYNVDYQIEHWTSQRFPKNKINLGIATYGRAWKMTLDSKAIGIPAIPATDGAADFGSQVNVSGVLSWPELCVKLQPKTQYSLHRFADPNRKYGTYAFRAVDEKGKHGVWVSYDDPEVAATKASYVSYNHLAGMAIFDLTMDDFRGQCSNDKFPFVKTISTKLE